MKFGPQSLILTAVGLFTAVPIVALCAGHQRVHTQDGWNTTRHTVSVKHGTQPSSSQYTISHGWTCNHSDQQRRFTSTVLSRVPKGAREVQTPHKRKPVSHIKWLRVSLIINWHRRGKLHGSHFLHLPVRMETPETSPKLNRQQQWRPSGTTFHARSGTLSLRFIKNSDRRGPTFSTRAQFRTSKNDHHWVIRYLDDFTFQTD